MHPTYILYAVLSAISISAVPLNINLGAYSPALVVGDGEISFDSTQKASELMETLATGAANAGQQKENQGQVADNPEEPAPEKARAVAPPNVRSPKPVTTPGPERVVARSPEPVVAHVPEPTPVRRAVDDLSSFDLVSEAAEWIKRDIVGFREALNFAREAMKNQPKVELGTGAEGSGVGVIVNAGINVPAESAANGAKPAGAEKRKVRRDLGVEAERGVETEENAGPKMTLVAITEV
jgi:hypothetical protein